MQSFGLSIKRFFEMNIWQHRHFETLETVPTICFLVEYDVCLSGWGTFQFRRSFFPMHAEKREKPRVHKGRPLSKEPTPMPYQRNEREEGRGKHYSQEKSGKL